MHFPAKSKALRWIMQIMQKKYFKNHMQIDCAPNYYSFYRKT